MKAKKYGKKSYGVVQNNDGVSAAHLFPVRLRMTTKKNTANKKYKKAFGVFLITRQRAKRRKESSLGSPINMQRESGGFTFRQRTLAKPIKSTSHFGEYKGKSQINPLHKHISRKAIKN